MKKVLINVQFSAYVQLSVDEHIIEDGDLFNYLMTPLCVNQVVMYLHDQMMVDMHHKKSKLITFTEIHQLEDSRTIN